MVEEKPRIVRLYTNSKFWVYLLAFFYLILLIILIVNNPNINQFLDEAFFAVLLLLWFMPGFTIVALWLKKIKNNLNYPKIKTIGTILLLFLLAQLIGCAALVASWRSS